MTWIDDYEAGIGLARDEEGEYMYVFAVGPEPGDEADEWGFPKYWSHILFSSSTFVIDVPFRRHSW